MKTTLTAVLIAALCGVPAFAADNSARPEGGTGQGVEQKKSEIQQHIDKRISLAQEEKICVQAAQSHDALKACREKFRPPKPKEENQNRNQ